MLSDRKSAGIAMAGSGDSGAMATFTVTSTADSGAGSLRQAILDANAADGRDAIVFAASFDGGAEDIIRLTSGQIAITGALRIDGGPGVTITGDAAGDDVTDAAGITDVAASGAAPARRQQPHLRRQRPADPRRPDPDRRATTADEKKAAARCGPPGSA